MSTPSRPNGAGKLTTLGEHAAGQIRELIVSGQLPAGTRVSHDDLAAALGVSRLPLRDAFIILEREGWVVVRRGRGTYVSEINADTVRDNFALYGLLFGLALERAFARSGPDLVGRLIEARDAFVAESDPAQRARNAIAFNRVILQAAHSDRLRSSLRALRGLPLGDFYRLLPSVAEAQEAAMTTIVTGVRDGDPTRATEAFRDLMQLAGEEISRLLAERGLLSDHPRKRPSDDEAAELVVTHLS